MKIKSKIMESSVIVIKIGSSILIKKDLFNEKKLLEILEDIKFFLRKKKKIILVASGAVALGKRYIKFQNDKKLTIKQKQALASCGQTLLMSNFLQIFNSSKLKVSQVLLTIGDTDDRKRSIQARDTLKTLMELNVVPVINENDTVANEELKFGDNDRLAARVAQIIDADLLILLGDVDGLYNKNPKNNPDARLISIIKKIGPEVINMADNNISEHGTGGMKTKLQAAEIAMSCGCDTIICSGLEKRPLKKIIDGVKINCTCFISNAKRKKNHFKNWLAASIKTPGRIIIDDGAFHALKKGASLLPSGVISVIGKFKTGDILEISTKNKEIIGKGIVSYDYKEVKLILGKNSKQIEEILGYISSDELIHRDNMIIK